MKHNFNLPDDVVEELPPIRHIVSLGFIDEASVDLAGYDQVRNEFQEFMRDCWNITASLRTTRITEQEVPVSIARLILQPKYGVVSRDDALLITTVAIAEWSEVNFIDPNLSVVFYRPERDDGKNNEHKIVTSKVKEIFSALGVLRNITPTQFVHLTAI